MSCVTGWSVTSSTPTPPMRPAPGPCSRPPGGAAPAGSGTVPCAVPHATAARAGPVNAAAAPVPAPQASVPSDGRAAMSIEVANESGVSVDEPALAALARHVLDEMHMHPLAELSVLLVDSATMADLHQRWLGEPGPTDVLAFPMDELRPPPPGSDRADRTGGSDPGSAPGLLGDVVLCPEVAASQAREATHEVSDELELLCTHGILHLLGFDHADPGERATMFGLQDR